MENKLSARQVRALLKKFNKHELLPESVAHGGAGSNNLSALAATAKHACIVTRGGTNKQLCCEKTRQDCLDFNIYLQSINPHYHAEPAPNGHCERDDCLG
jgi:hypothetical protein